MPQIQTTITVAAPASQIYSFLRNRYDSENYKIASISTKGYVPKIRCLAEETDREISFTVPGRDPILRISIAGWSWSYHLEPAENSATKVTITYSWNWFTSILGAGTAKHQASNELVETVTAIDALVLRKA